SPVDLAGEGAEAALVDDLARHREREQRPPVEGVLEDDDATAPRRGACDLHRVLDPLRAGVEEDAALLLARARRQLGEPPADLDVRLVDAHHEALVQVAVELVADRGRDRAEAVARVLARDPAREVEVPAAVGVPDPSAL